MSTLAKQYHRPLRKFSLGDKKNLVIRLVLINLVIFAGLFFTKMVYKVTDAPEQLYLSQVIPWAVLPGDVMKLITHPWTLLTYMFVHTNFWLLLSTMVWLWGYGELLQGMYGPRYILPLYLLGGLAGAATYVLAFQFIPGLNGFQATATSINIGASASVMAVVICTTVLLPKFRIFPMLAGGIPLFVITIAFLVLNFIGKEGGELYGYLAANVGGLLLGAYFGYRIKKGYQPEGFMNKIIYKFSHLFEPKEEQFSAENTTGRSHNPDKPFQRVGPVSENKIDEILDKINLDGIESLTAEEKEALMRASKEEN